MGRRADDPAVLAVRRIPTVRAGRFAGRSRVPLLARRHGSVRRAAAPDVRAPRRNRRARLAARQRTSRATRCAGSAGSPSWPTGRSMPAPWCPRWRLRTMLRRRVRPSSPRCAGRQPPDRQSTPTSTPSPRRCHRSASPDIPADDLIARRHDRRRDLRALRRQHGSRPPPTGRVGPCRRPQSVGDDGCAAAGVPRAHRTEPAPSDVAASGGRRLRAGRRSAPPARTSGPWRAGARATSAPRRPRRPSRSVGRRARTRRRGRPGTVVQRRRRVGRQPARRRGRRRARSTSRSSSRWCSTLAADDRRSRRRARADSARRRDRPPSSSTSRLPTSSSTRLLRSWSGSASN